MSYFAKLHDDYFFRDQLGGKPSASLYIRGWGYSGEEPEMAPMREETDWPTRHKLSELDGATITLSNTPLRKVTTSYGEATMATLDDGSELFLPKHVVEKLESPIAGSYTVYSFVSKQTGKRGYSLRNAYTQD